MTASQSADGKAGPAMPRLLLVEDDRLTRGVFSHALRHLGYQVAEAVSGEEALELAARSAFDLIIADLRLPGISGLDAARRINEDTGTPFVMLTAYSDPALVAEVTGAGALGYLVKPLEIHQIVPAIEAALKRAEETRRLKASEAGIDAALGQARDISVAIGLVMERLKLSREAAHEHLRSRARSQRRKLVDLARGILDGSEEP
jgi:AmiR/NasT family two-component response regulator